MDTLNPETGDSTSGRNETPVGVRVLRLGIAGTTGPDGIHWFHGSSGVTIRGRRGRRRGAVPGRGHR